MKLVADKELEQSSVVANCKMNRERNLLGTNGYEKDLRFNPLDFLGTIVAKQGKANWLDLCCGSGKALIDAAAIVDTENLPIEIIGVDLVGMFLPSSSNCLELVEASLTEWVPNGKFDLITCVHGLHYIGDKLKLVARARTWLSQQGKFVGNLDADNLWLGDSGPANQITAAIRRSGMEYSSRTHLLSCKGWCDEPFPLSYLGADDKAGPNYTGQAAVNSHYTLSDSSD
ncbi:class I SAM-dependent methyltransferase [Novipirellula aureliae]|nr:class I SAM-dependent methyltransferase [Novipirellula aureliae]